MRSPRSCRCRRRPGRASSELEQRAARAAAGRRAPIYPDDYLTDQPERALVAETVREKVLQHTRAELPFSTAVVVDQFDESERERILRLYCTIFVETESQKPIVIGRGGEMIKRIGTDARQDLEAFFETKVFLDLRVKVNPDWREQRAMRSTRSACLARRGGRRSAGGEGQVRPSRWAAFYLLPAARCFSSSARNAFSDRSIAARQPCGSTNAASPLPAAAAADFSGSAECRRMRGEEHLAGQGLLDFERAPVVRFDRRILLVLQELRSRIHGRAAEEHDLALLSGGVLHRHRPGRRALRVPRRQVRGEGDRPYFDDLSIFHGGVHLRWWEVIRGSEEVVSLASAGDEGRVTC